MKKSLLTIFALIFLMIATGNSFAQITSAATGNWSDAATWIGGVVPSGTTDVVISAGQTVTVDLPDAACKNLSVDGTVTFPDAEARAINIFGNLTVNATGKFNTFSSGSPSVLRNHSILITGDLTVITGGTFDMRRGSNPNPAVGTVIFSGPTTSNITLSQTAYGSSIEEFNSITISKVSGAKVILKAGNLYQSNNSSTAPTILTLTSGIVETQGTSIWGYLSTSSSNIVGDFANCYFTGALGRGLSNTSGNFAKRDFPVGDNNGYRPVTIRSSAGLVTGHLLVVQAVSGNANSGTSTFSGGVDRVSAARYYKVSYTRSGTLAAASLNLDTLGVSYAAGDGVAEGNTNLRVAYSTNDRALWTGVPQTVAHTTTLTTPPTTIVGDLLTTPINLADGASCYIALARVTGTTENTLIGTTDVEKEEGLPTAFELSQNYPNPFNPTTSISFSIPQSGFVTLKVYDVIGKEIASLVNEQKDAGNYRFNFDATKLSSGIYFYRLQAGNFVSTKKMVLMK